MKKKVKKRKIPLGRVSIVYNVDARGATDPAATAIAIQRAIKQSEDRAVQRALGTQRGWLEQFILNARIRVMRWFREQSR